jgi:hypothetical protein
MTIAVGGAEAAIIVRVTGGVSELGGSGFT